MKHKRWDLTKWARWGTGTATVLRLPEGVLADFKAHKVKLPLVMDSLGQQVCVFDDGYRWIHFAPTGQNHALTVKSRGDGSPVQLYVDICQGHGQDPDGMPFVNDLYLDVIASCKVQADGSWRVTGTEIIDQDDLDAALAKGKITQAQFDFAWAEARAVQMALEAQQFKPVAVVQAYLRGQPFWKLRSMLFGLRRTAAD